MVNPHWYCLFSARFAEWVLVPSRKPDVSSDNEWNLRRNRYKPDTTLPPSYRICRPLPETHLQSADMRRQLLRKSRTRRRSIDAPNRCNGSYRRRKPYSSSSEKNAVLEPAPKPPSGGGSFILRPFAIPALIGAALRPRCSPTHRQRGLATI